MPTMKELIMILEFKMNLILVVYMLDVVVVYLLPWTITTGGFLYSRMWSTSQLIRPSGQQCTRSSGVCPQIQGWQCCAGVDTVEEMMCVMCVRVT